MYRGGGGVPQPSPVHGVGRPLLQGSNPQMIKSPLPVNSHPGTLHLHLSAWPEYQLALWYMKYAKFKHPSKHFNNSLHANRNSSLILSFMLCNGIAQILQWQNDIGLLRHDFVWAS